MDFITCKCGTENRKGAKFCEDCGSILHPVCGECGKPVEQGKKFCGECGHPVVAKSATEGNMEWKRASGEFSRKIELATNNRLLSGGINVQPGTTAIIIMDGQVVGQVSAKNYSVEAIETAPPGKGGNEGVLRSAFERIKRFWKEKEINPALSYPDVSALLVDAGETPLRFSFKDKKTSDPLIVNADLDVRLAVKDPLLFLANVIKGKSAYSEEDVQADIKIAVEKPLTEMIRRSTLANLLRDSESVAASLREVVNAIVERDGYTIVTVLPPSFQQEGLDTADKIKSESAEKEAIRKALIAEKFAEGEAENQMGSQSRRQLETKAAITDEMRVIHTQDEASILRHRDIREEVEHGFGLKKEDRDQEREMKIRDHSNKILQNEMSTESQIKRHEESERYKGAESEEEIVNFRNGSALGREKKRHDFDLESKAKKIELAKQAMMGLLDIQSKEGEITEKAVASDHQREIEKLKLDQTTHLETKKIDLEGKKIDAGRDVDIAKADAERSREHADELVETYKRFGEKTDSDKEKMLEMAERMSDRFAQFGEKSIEAVAGGSRKQQEKVEKMAEKHSDQITDVALAKAKALGSSAQKEEKDSRKVTCPHCRSEVKLAKYCDECGKTLLA